MDPNPITMFSHPWGFVLLGDRISSNPGWPQLFGIAEDDLVLLHPLSKLIGMYHPAQFLRSVRDGTQGSMLGREVLYCLNSTSISHEQRE